MGRNLKHGSFSPHPGDGRSESTVNTSAHARVGRRVLVGTLGALLPLMILLSHDFGVTWDEPVRQGFGKLIVEYYQGKVGISRFQSDGARLYGGLFDVTAVGLQSVLPFDPYVVRHAWNACFGWLGIVACAALAARMAGPWAGLLAALFAATAPRYLAHSMNNPKDIPFAALAAWSLYAMSRVRFTYPYLPPGLAVATGVAIGLTLSVRPGGVLFVAYAAGLVVMAIVANRERSPRRLAATAAAFALLAFVATTLPLPVWPWLQTRPYLGLFSAAAEVSHYNWEGDLLFNGRQYQAGNTPWTYVPVWLVYTVPPVVLAGAGLSLIRLHRGAGDRIRILCLWFAVLFPIAYVIARESTVYDEIRQLLFIIPPLFVLAAVGWWRCLETATGWRRVAAAALAVAGLLEPIVFQIRNHPNQVVYFNALVGGPRGAFRWFELDYWGNCHLEAMRRAGVWARETRQPVVMSGNHWRVMALNAGRMADVTVKDQRLGEHELEVKLLRGRRLELARMIEQPDILYRVTTADGTPLCLVLPGPRYANLEARLRSAREAPSTR